MSRQIDQEVMIKKSMLIEVFKSCLDTLRVEGLVGDKALRNLSYFLILKLLEPRFGVEIDIDNYEGYDFSHIEEENVENHKNRLLEIVRFSNLSKEKEDNIPGNMKYLWDDILAIHPSTRNIFLEGKGFDIKYKSTYKTLIDKLISLDLSNIEYDILGDAYEEVIKDIMIGKVFGQFFTPPVVKKVMIKLLDPQVHSDGKIDTIADPFLGTAGFLTVSQLYLSQQAKTKNIKLDWKFITSEGLYGKEIEPDTYQLAVSNLLISTGHMFDRLDRGDSIRDPIVRKFDHILTNPPFGIKGLKYDNFKGLLKSEYLPIKTDHAVSLSIQAIIYMLKIGGKCAVVLPNGEDLFSTKDKKLILIREYLLKTCDLKEIIYLPSGIFANTPTKTCIFYFVKKVEGTDILKIKIKISPKTQKETGRGYEFSQTHQTTVVGFYEYNPYEDVKNLLVEVPVEKIAENSYSLNYTQYMKDETKEEKYGEGIVIKTLGEVCNFDIGGTPSRSKNEYYENGNNLWVSVRELNGGYIYDTKEKITDLGVQNSNVKLFDKDTILFSFKLSIGKTAIVGNPLYSNEAIAGIVSKNNVILDNRYLYYYLTISDFSNLGSGIIGNGSLNKKSLGQIKIPIPPLEHQQEIVKYLDFIYEKANRTSNEKITELKQLNEFCLSNQKIIGDNVVKTLGEVCSIDYGTRIVKSNNIEGEYPVYGSGRAMFYTNVFNREGYNILIGRFALSLECVRIINEKIFLNDSGLSVKPKTDILLHKYVGYYLLHNQSIIYNCARGTAQKNLEMDIFKSIKIHIPSLERQKEIVEYCEYNDILIKRLEKEIENNKKQAQQFLTKILQG